MPKLFYFFLIHPALYMLKVFRDFHLQKTIQHLISTEMPEILIFTHIQLH